MSAHADRVSELCARTAPLSAALTESEMLELVVGLDAHTAAALLAGRTLRAVLALTSAELAAAGVSDVQGARLRALVSIVERAGAERLVRGDKLADATAVFRHYHATMRELRVEQFRVVLLDAKGRVIGEELISQGTLTSSMVHPREVFAPAIRQSAHSVIVVHNHPSGDPTPSADDREITTRLVDAGHIVGIRVVDHVVIGDGTYVSFQERGLLEAR